MKSIGTNLYAAAVALTVFCSSLPAAEWNGGTDWAVFDVPARRAMWVWDMGKGGGSRNWDGTHGYVRGLENYKGARDLCLDFCRNKSIRSIYVFNATWEWDRAAIEAGTIPNEAAWTALMTDAASRGIQVWLMGYLWDDPNDSRMTDSVNKESLKKIMQAIHAFNQAHPNTPIAGFHNDQEPGNSAVYDDLLDTMKIAQDWVNAYAPDLLLSQALRPVWRNTQVTWSGRTQYMNQHIIEMLRHNAYMAYSDSPNTVLNTYALPACNLAGPVGHKVAVGLEVGDLAAAYPNADKDTWYEEIKAEPAATRFLTDPASPVTFEDCLHTADSALQDNAGYDRMVIHSYASYFEHWFGLYPRDYILSQTGGLYNSAAVNPGVVNLLLDSRPLSGLGPGGVRLDSDNDSFPDALEIALGSDPQNSASLPIITSILNTVSPDGFTLGWQAVTGLRYRVLTSQDMVVWSVLSDWQPGSGSWRELAVATTAFPSGNCGFLIVEAALP